MSHRISLTQGCASHPQPGGGSPPDLTIFANWGGGGGEIFSKIMTHFGLIKLESSNLLDITTDAF